MRLLTDYTDGDVDQEAAFHLLCHTSCLAVLTEVLFKDNQANEEYILSDIGQTILVNFHVSGITFYLGIH